MDAEESFKLQEKFEEIPLFRAAFIMMNFVVLVAFGYLRDFMRARNWEPSLFKVERAAQAVPKFDLTLFFPIRCVLVFFLDDSRVQDFPPLYSGFERFFSRNLYMRARDCFNRPISGCVQHLALSACVLTVFLRHRVPGAHVMLKERVSHQLDLRV